MHARRGQFHRLRYGPCLIAMNMTPDQTFPLPIPPGSAEVPELISGKKVAPARDLPVPPRSTVVLYLGSAK